MLGRILVLVLVLVLGPIPLLDSGESTVKGPVKGTVESTINSPIESTAKPVYCILRVHTRRCVVVLTLPLLLVRRRSSICTPVSITALALAMEREISPDHAIQSSRRGDDSHARDQVRAHVCTPGHIFADLGVPHSLPHPHSHLTQ